MKVGDKVTILVHGAGVTSEEEYIIEEIDDEKLKLEDLSDIFYKYGKGNYCTEVSSFGFWFEVKEE